MNSSRASLLLGLLTFAVCFIAAEAGTRLLLRSRTPAGMTFSPDIVYGYSPRAVVEGMTMNDIGCIGDDVLVPRRVGERRFLLLGESTSFSQYYVDRLRQVIRRAMPEVVPKVVSCGRPRYTSYTVRSVYGQVSRQVLPDIVIVYMGINDAIYDTFPWLTGVPDIGFFDWKSPSESLFLRLAWYHLVQKRLLSTPDFLALQSEAIFQANLTALLGDIRRDGAKPVVGTFAISFPTTDASHLGTLRRREAEMQHFWGKVESTARAVSAHNAVTRGLAQDLGVPLAAVDAAIPHDGVHFVDLCHLTHAGYDRLVSSLVETLSTL